MKKASFQARRYERSGLLAIDPSALFEVFVAGDAAPENQEVPGATLVTVRGPLDQHASRWCDSYEAITARVSDACEAPAPAIVLLMDSPGGEAAGCIEAARDIRAMCDAAGKKLFAFVEHKAASAGYALASAADEIILADTAIVGSIGILQTRTDYSAMNAARGVNVAFIASGNRKAFGNPDAPLTEAEVKDTQQLVDSVALVFFELVSEMRGVDAAKLEAGVFHGQAAINAGLADAVMPLKTALASIARTQGQTAMAADGDKKDKKEESGFDAARAALETLAKGDDANAKRAKLALAALEAEGEDADGDKDGDKKAADGGDDQSAADDSDDQKAAEGGDDDKKEDKAEAAMRLALRAERRAAKLEAQLKAKDDDAERTRLIDAHPDLSASMVALLRKSPLALVRETLAEIDADADADADGSGAAANKQPAKGVSARAALASAKAKPTLAAKTARAGTEARLSEAAKADLDRRCGLTAESALGVRESEYRLELGVIGAEPAKPKADTTKGAA